MRGLLPEGGRYNWKQVLTMASTGSPGSEGNSCPATDTGGSWGPGLGCLTSEALDRNQGPPISTASIFPHYPQSLVPQTGTTSNLPLLPKKPLCSPGTPEGLGGLEFFYLGKIPGQTGKHFLLIDLEMAN